VIYLKAILVMIACLHLSVLKGQESAAKSFAEGSQFLVDPSKPYVYLELDHVGPRKPLREGEPDIGIWLRLKNNCKLPIVVIALGATPRSPGEVVSLVDEVVPNPRAPETWGDGISGGILIPHGLEEMNDIFRSPNMTEAEVRGAENTQKRGGQEGSSKGLPERPRGYNGGYEPVAPTLTVIPPGGQVLFSLPANHVSKTWHFEIPFRFALPSNQGLRAPYSYVAFFQEELKDDRRDATRPMPTAH
jgi:hypothetical protein